MDEKDEHRTFLLQRLLTNLESERIMAAVYDALAYAKSTGKKDATKKLRLILHDSRFTRRVGRLDAIKTNPETTIEYYDEDKDNDPYAYDAATEKKIATLKEYLLGFAADIINETGGDAENILAALGGKGK